MSEEMQDVIDDFMRWIRDGLNTDEHPNLIESNPLGTDLVLLEAGGMVAAFEILPSMAEPSEWTAYFVGQESVGTFEARRIPTGSRYDV